MGSIQYIILEEKPNHKSLPTRIQKEKEPNQQEDKDVVLRISLDLKRREKRGISGEIGSEHMKSSFKNQIQCSKQRNIEEVAIEPLNNEDTIRKHAKSIG